LDISKIKKAILTFNTENKFVKRDAEKIRGYFGTIYKEEDLFHNHAVNVLDHTVEKKVIYRMPLIQYKVINGNITIVGFNEGVDILSSKFIHIDKIQIDDVFYYNFETQFTIMEEEFTVVDEFFNYSFESLWLAINQKNYVDFMNQNLDLNKVLQNNILTNFKNLGIMVEKRIIVDGYFKQRSVEIDNINHIAFKGNFKTNVIIPDLMSFGRMRSIGFGTVRRDK
jgi:hypothetical protein